SEASLGKVGSGEQTVAPSRGSLRADRRSVRLFAAQRMRERGGNGDLCIAANERGVAGEVDDAIVVGARRKLAFVAGGVARYDDALLPSDHSLAERAVLFLEQRREALEAGLRDARRNRIRHLGGRSAGTRAVDEAERAVEPDIGDEAHRLLEIGVGLARKADDEVGGKRQTRANGAQPPYDRLVLERRIPALHRREHAVRPRL